MMDLTEITPPYLFQIKQYLQLGNNYASRLRDKSGKRFKHFKWIALWVAVDPCIDSEIGHLTEYR